ncbi:MAG: cytochrome P450 [Pseudomonadota bacterium]
MLRHFKDLPRATPRDRGQPDLHYLRALQRLGPLVVDKYGLLMCFSHDDFQFCITTPETRQIETDILRLMGVTSGPAFEFVSNSLLFSNGDLHKSRRAPMARTFAWSLMEALRSEIRGVAMSIVEPLKGKGVDFVAQISGPLPAHVIARIIGAPEADIPKFTRLVYSASRAISYQSPDIAAEATRDMGALATYVEGLLDDRRAIPRDDFLTDFVAQTGGMDLSAAEIRSQIMTLILAGSDTTRLSLAMAVVQLLQEPGAWDTFRADPDGLKGLVVSEALRLEPPVGAMARIFTDDVERHDTLIPAGTIVSASFLTAQRDPEVYDQPDSFRPGRQDMPRHHPVFGAGPHRCLGEALARAELEEALVVLAELCPDLRLDGPAPVPRGLGAVRSIGAMPVVM